MKRSRLQSQLAPMRIIWRLMRVAVFLLSIPRRGASNSSRPMVAAVMPFGGQLRSTTIWVAMPA